MKDFLLCVAKHIVNDPEAVEVKETEVEGMVSLRLKVAPEDMGRIIGKNGKIINSIRTLTRILAIKEEKRVQIDLEEVPGQEKPVKSIPEEQVVLENTQE